MASFNKALEKRILQKLFKPLGILQMIIEKIVMLAVGTMVLASSLLTVYHTDEWIYLAAFVGASLLFSGVTGFCPMVKILEKFGFKHGSVFK